MLFYPAALPLSRQTLTYTAGIIRRHRQQISSPWRRLSPGRQALLVLAYLRTGDTFAGLAAGFGIGTAWRYVKHGMNLQVISSPQGELLWVSGPLPGAVRDLTAARIRGHRGRAGRLRPGRAGR